MTTFTRILSAAALAAVLAAPVPAQRGRQAGSQFEKIATELNLSADQKAKIQPILQEEGGKLRALRSDQSLTQEDRRSKALAIQKETRERVLPILTKEQAAKWDEIRRQVREGARKNAKKKQ